MTKHTKIDSFRPMKFEEILNNWENRPAQREDKKRKQLADWLDAYPPTDDVVHDEKEHGHRSSMYAGAENRNRVRNLEPQRSLDLHGFRAVEAESAVREFIDRASRDGLEKVLIIHGKGKHSRKMKS